MTCNNYWEESDGNMYEILRPARCKNRKKYTSKKKKSHKKKITHKTIFTRFGNLPKFMELQEFHYSLRKIQSAEV